MRHRPKAGLIIHSDRDSSAPAGLTGNYSKKSAPYPAMSRRTNCYANAMMESFWSTLKAECFASHLPATHREACSMIFEYIETYSNRLRLHSSLGYQSPGGL